MSIPTIGLSLAMERMGTSGVNVLPVVSRANVHQLVGVVALDDILSTYGVAKPANAKQLGSGIKVVSLFGGRSFLATFGLVFLAIAGIFAADMFLAKTDRAESQIEATRLFRRGPGIDEPGPKLPGN